MPEQDRMRRTRQLLPFTPDESPLKPNTPVYAPPDGSALSPEFGHSFTQVDITTPRDNEGDQETFLPGAAMGTAGAMGRSTMVGAQEGRAYGAGLNAPRTDFDGTVYRNAPTAHRDGYANHFFSEENGGRYHDVGARMLYTSPSVAENVGEMGAYSSMANRTMVEMNYQAPLDPTTGKGGVADVSRNLADLGLTRDALTAKKGGGTPDIWHRLTGEDPYLYPRAVGRGATDAGASGMQVPSATGGNQIDIIPKNTAPAQIQPTGLTDYDGGGRAGTLVTDPAQLASLKPMPAGDAPNPLSIQPPSEAIGRTMRAGSARYGLVGGIGGALVNDVVQGRGPSLDTAADLTLQGGVGMSGGVAQDWLHARMGSGISGGVAAGGAISAITSGAFSAYDNGEAYRQGKETAGQATANTIVDTGVGLSAGLAGAGLGAAIGSVIPVAGTAVGAGVGFLAGMAGSYAANYLAEHSGVTDWAKKGLGGVLNNYNDTLSGTWDGIGHATKGIHDSWDETKRGIHGAEHAVADRASHAWQSAEHLGSNLLHGGEHAAANAWHGAEHLASRGLHGAEYLGLNAIHGAEHIGLNALHGAEHLGIDAVHGAEHLGSRAWHGAEAVASGALHGAENVAQGVGDAASSTWNKVTGWF